MEETSTGFAAFIDKWSPIDFILIGQNLDRFVYGAFVTLELTILALILGGLISIPMAIARADKKNFFIRESVLWKPIFVASLVVRTNRIYLKHRSLYHRAIARRN